MTPQHEPLTPAEWKIMRIVWQQKRCAARDVYEPAADQHGLSVSTVKTHLRRLVDKGYLKTTRVGNSFLYQAKRSLLRSLFPSADRLLERSVDGATGPLLAYMVENSKMSADELAQLRALLDRYEPTDDTEPEA